MDVSDVKVTVEDGFLSCSMMIKAKNIMKERIWINRVDQRGVTGTQSLHTEPQRCQIQCREVSNETRVNWKTFPLCGPIQGVQDCTCECP